MATIGTVATIVTSEIVIAEPRNVTWGNFSITETEPGVFTLTGPGLDMLSDEDREDVTSMLSVWKYGLVVDGDGTSPSTWAPEKLASARAWLADHRGE
jgi:hypothetical protein